VTRRPPVVFRHARVQFDSAVSIRAIASSAASCEGSEEKENT
jgi:hypothetical protein